MSKSGSAHAWLSMLRISNAPTVVSQVFAGAAVGCYALPAGTTLPLSALVLVLVGVPLSYLAGMILNDVFDAQLDATERPDRPIPSGRIFSRRSGARSAVRTSVFSRAVTSAGRPAGPDSENHTVATRSG